MAVITPVRASDRPPHIKRGFIASTWRGKLRAQSWPRKRPARPPSYVKNLRDQLRQVVAWQKTVHPREQNPMREAILRQNRTHRGFKGSAAIRHRDIEVQRAALRLFIFILPDGRIWFPKWIVRDNCDLLDWLIRNLAGIGMRRKGVWAKAPINQNTKVMFAPDEPPE